MTEFYEGKVLPRACGSRAGWLLMILYTVLE